ncbi:unnamed protein product [Cuscuta campestris]|uniref:Ubiquitin-like protease family profile domain-containing protein n=1 Tax=Cuscuta campestris TaxID=132261 RepID=A0A484NDV8_9ASTE|nr:unnamed protein product [Cuscuta campestris]
MWWVTKESVEWNEMVATTSEKAKENIAMLFSVGDSRKAKGEKKGLIRKRARVKKMEKKMERSGSGTLRGTPKKAKNILGDTRENEPSLRDIMTTIVLMEKRNLKMRMEVTKLRIALNAHTRLLNGYISRKKIGKRWHTSKKRTTEDNNMPSFDLRFESQEKNDATEYDVADDVWEEDLNVEAEIGTQLGSCGNDLHDPLNDISTQEVEGRWLKSLHGLGLGKHSEKNVDKQECEKGLTNMVKDAMQSSDVGNDVAVEDVPCTGVDEPKEASPMNVEVSASVMNGQENVLRSGTGCDLLRAVCEEVKDSEDDDEVVNEEPCTQIVVYEAPMASEAPTDLMLNQKKPLKCPDRFTPDDLVVRRKTKRVRTESARVVQFGGDEDEFMGPFPSDPNEMPAQEELMKVEKFMYQGLLKNHLRVSGRKYGAQADVLDPSEYKHPNVIFYYLRMKGVEFGLEQRYMTTDTPFLALLKTLFGRYMKKELTIEQAMRNNSVRSTIIGGKMEYGRPWKSADFVYMPLNTRNHWTLLVLDIKQKLIRIYDSSIRRNDSKRKLHSFLPCLQMFLPKIMDKLGLYDGWEEGPVGDDVLAVEAGPCCPQQNDGSSCGMFVVKMAELLMMSNKKKKRKLQLHGSMLRKKKKEQENHSSVQNPEHKTISPLEHPEGIAKKVRRWNVEVSELIVGLLFIDIPEILNSNFLLTSGPIYAILPMLKRNTFYTKVIALHLRNLQNQTVCNSVKKRWRYAQNTAGCPIVTRLTKLVNFDVVSTPAHP